MPDYDVTINVMPWKRGLDAVRNGKAAAIFPPYRTEDRLHWMYLSEPILEEQIVVFGKAESFEGKTEWPDDFFWGRTWNESRF